MAKKGQLKISSNEFSSTIQELLNEYGSEVEFAMEEAMRLASLDAVKELEKGGSYEGGKEYNQGWDSQKKKEQYIVYNANKPGLAHLLEFGHAKQNGGRTKEFVHIQPVNDSMESRLVERFEKLL